MLRLTQHGREPVIMRTPNPAPLAKKTTVFFWVWPGGSGVPTWLPTLFRVGDTLPLGRLFSQIAGTRASWAVLRGDLEGTAWRVFGSGATLFTRTGDCTARGSREQESLP